MEQTPKVPEQTQQAKILAARVKDLRIKRGWSAERLAHEMTAVGVHWNRLVVTKLENGHRRDVSVTELLALGRVLQCAPVHLIVPPDADADTMEKLRAQLEADLNETTGKAYALVGRPEAGRPEAGHPEAGRSEAGRREIDAAEKAGHG